MHVVLGANGALGLSIVEELIRKNEPVKAVVRKKNQLQHKFDASVTIVEGDALDEDQVCLLLREARYVYHCINVSYQQWSDVMPKVTQNIANCMPDQALLVFPGNVYGLGKLQYIPVNEDHPKQAHTKKGRLRNELEYMLQETFKGQFRLVIPRFPDYYGPNVTNRLFGAIFTSALKGRRAWWPGDLHNPHDLIYIRDAARACVLLATEQKSGEWHVPGAGPITGKKFVKEVFYAAGQQRIPISCLSKRILYIAGIFDVEAREMVELLYQFEKPLVLNGSKWRETFPFYTFTSYQEAIKETLHWFRDYLWGE